VHGLLGILPIQVGITRDSLLTKDTLLAPSSLQSLHPLEPAICIEALTRPAFSSYPPSRLKLTQYRAVRDLLIVAHGGLVAALSGHRGRATACPFCGIQRPRPRTTGAVESGPD
jgi:hypothetical protein